MARRPRPGAPTQRAQAIQSFGTSALNYRLPIFMVLCLVLGGTSQDIVGGKAVIYALSLGLIAWTVIQDGPRTKVYPDGLGRAVTGPLIILLAAIIIFVAYLIPMPAEIWPDLPGRGIVKYGYEQIGMDLPALPLSLTPDYTFNALFDFLPPLAILLTAALTRSARELMLTLYAVVLVTVITFPIGLMQAFNPGQFKFYEISNIGVPVGFFSNSNHHAIFNVMAVPLTIYIASRGYRRLKSNEDGVPKIALAAMALILMVTSVLLAESFAAFGLIIIVSVLSLPMVFSKQLKRPKVMMGVVTVVAIFAAMTILKAGDLQTLFSDKLNDSESVSRSIIYGNTLEAIKSMGWIGSGPGSFYDVYLMYEDRATMTTTFANQAHNDPLQLILELGVFGAGLMAAFALWFITACVKGVTASRRSRKLILILLVSTLAVILHSFVDYPLRTIALASFTAFNVGYITRLLRG